MYELIKFTHVVNQPRSTQITSNTIVMTQACTVTLSPSGFVSTIASSQIIKNGVPVSSPTTVVPTDTIAVRGTTPATYEGAVFAALLFSGIGYAIWGAITIQDPATAAVSPANLNNPVAPFQYSQSAPNNRILVVTPGTATFTSHPLADAVGPGPINDNLPYVFAPNYTDDVVQRLDVNGNVVQTMATSGPYSVAYTPIYSPEEATITHTLITDPDNNQIHVYAGDDHTFEYSINTGLKPFGVAGVGTNNANEYAFWVTCQGSDRVEFWKFNGTTCTRQFFFTLTAGSLPTSLVVDGSNNAYVTCVGTNRVAKVFVDGTTAPVYLTTSGKPVNIIINEFKTHAYVFCADVAITNVIALSTNTVTNITTQKYLSCGTVAADRLFVGSLYSNVFGYYPLTSTTTISAFVSMSTTHRLIEGMTVSDDRTKVYVLVQHEDAPNLIGLPDKSPDSLTQYLTNDLTPSAVLTSPQQLITGIDSTATIRVPTMSAARLMKNGVDSGQSVSFTNNDLISFRATVPATGLPVLMPVIWAGGFVDFLVDLLDDEEGPGTYRTRVAGYMGGG